MSDDRLFLESLVESEVLTPEQRDHVLAEQDRTGASLRDTVIRLGLMDDATFLRYQAAFHDIPQPDSATELPSDDSLANTPEADDDGTPTAVRLLNALLVDAVRRGASHIHIEPDEGGVAVRLRIDGRIHQALRLPRILRASITGRLKIIGMLDIAERRIPQNGRFTLELEDQPVEFMISTLPLGNGIERIVLQRGAALARIPLAELGLEGLERLRACLAARSGLLLIAGLNHCGRTTTLHAIAEELAQAGRVVAFVDAARERPLRGVAQVTLERYRQFGLEQALAAMRFQDLDAIVTGHLWPGEALTAATQAALDGRLVVAGIHGRSAASALSLLRDMEVDPIVLSTVLTAVVAQRLFRRLCDCREPDTAPSAWRPRGCPRCAGSGYRGYALASTLCIVDEPLREAIRRRAPLTLPGPTLRDASLALVARGITSRAEALADPSLE
jgi:general secretion pathway protein E